MHAVDRASRSGTVSVPSAEGRFVQGEGELLILDEWDSAEHFQEFFSSQEKIGQMMHEAGVAGPPQIEVYEVLKTAGDF